MKTGILHLREYGAKGLWFNSLYVVDKYPLELGKEIINNPEKYFNLYNKPDYYEYRLVKIDKTIMPSFERIIRDVNLEIRDKGDDVCVFFVIDKENSTIFNNKQWKICRYIPIINGETNEISSKDGYIESALNEMTLDNYGGILM